MFHKSVWFLTAAIGLAIGLDIYIQNNQLGLVSGAVFGLLTLICVIWHLSAALPMFHSRHEEIFEQSLFVFCLNMLLLLSLFIVLRPEIAAWYQSTDSLALNQRFMYASLLTVLSGGLLTLGWKGLEATVACAERTRAQRRIQVDVTAYSASMGTLLFLLPLLQSEIGQLLQLVAAVTWLLLCVYIVVDVEDKTKHSREAYLSVALVLGLVLLLGYPVRTQLQEHGAEFRDMTMEQALDFMLPIVVWGVAAVKIGADQFSHIIHRLLGTNQ